MTAPSITRIEAATISSWPSLSSAMDGLWLARFARGYTKRANSVQCLDPADDGDAPARLRRMSDLYALNSREPIFRVTPLAGPRIVAALDADGWAPFEESCVLAMPLDRAFPETPGLRIYDGNDRNWIEGLSEIGGMDRRPRETLTLLLDLIAHRNAGILIREPGGDPVAPASPSTPPASASTTMWWCAPTAAGGAWAARRCTRR